MDGVQNHVKMCAKATRLEHCTALHCITAMFWRKKRPSCNSQILVYHCWSPQPQPPREPSAVWLALPPTLVVSVALPPLIAGGTCPHSIHAVADLVAVLLCASALSIVDHCVGLHIRCWVGHYHIAGRHDGDGVCNRGLQLDVGCVWG